MLNLEKEKQKNIKVNLEIILENCRTLLSTEIRHSKMEENEFLFFMLYLPVERIMRNLC